jgi:transposase
MQETAFFTQLLGISRPWFISKVNLNKAEKRVDIYIQHSRDFAFPCPKCQRLCSVYDHMKEREFRHLNVCQMATFIHVRISRIECPEDGVLRIIHGLGEENSPMTYEFESFGLDLEQEWSIESVCRLLDMNWHPCWGVMERGVERGRQRKAHRIPERIGVDEKSFAKGHRYETLVYDIDTATVDYVGDKRDQDSLDEYYKQFSLEERQKVKAVAMDMWDPYIAATKAYIPEAERKIVFDRYHVMRLVVDAVDKVRKQEHRALMEDGNELLKGTKYLWLWNEENIPPYRWMEFEYLRSLDLKVCRARAIKDNLRNLWNYHKEGWMRRYFSRWYFWATHSRLSPIINAAKSLKSHIDNIVTYARHRITNALGESLNSKIEKVKRLGCGYRNRATRPLYAFIHLGRRPRVYAGRNAIVIRFGVMSPFTPGG